MCLLCNVTGLFGNFTAAVMLSDRETLWIVHSYAVLVVYVNFDNSSLRDTSESVEILTGTNWTQKMTFEEVLGKRITALPGKDMSQLMCC